MEPALKQRLIGAAVLVALAVIFLPMLVQGPAPESGAADVPLDMPAQPTDEFVTRELPLVAPGATPEGGVVGFDMAPPQQALPTVDTADASASSESLPPTTAAGGYAVAMGTFPASAGADIAVNRLRTSGLPGYRDRAVVDGETRYRVRIGPYASRAQAEAVRLRAAQARPDADARVVVLDAGRDEPEVAAAAPATGDTSDNDTPEQAPEQTQPAAEAVASAAPEPEPEPEPATPAPAAAADAGFVVQLGAFRDNNDAIALRDRVRGAGFTVFSQQVRTEQGVLTRIMVGPVIDRGRAEQLQAQVQAKFKINGLVRSYP